MLLTGLQGPRHVDWLQECGIGSLRFVIGKTSNLYDVLAPRPRDEELRTLLRRDGVRIERIVSYGHASPEGFWYDQAEHEWVVVLEGAARLRFEDESSAIELGPGDYVDIPAHRKHRVEWTAPDEPTIWLAVHCSDETR